MKKFRKLHAFDATLHFVGAHLRANATRYRSLNRADVGAVRNDSFERKRAPTSSPSRGFTLVEVIVAIVIAALCFSALSGVFSSGMRAASTASELARASTLAQSLIASVGIERPLVDGVESGTSADGLNWTVSVAEEASAAEAGPIKPVFELKRVTARVVVPNEAQPDRARAFELSTLRAVPTPVLQ